MKNIIVRNTEPGKSLILVSTIILYPSSILLPIILVFLIQDSLYHSSTYWFFETPISSYITFFIGMVWIPIVLTLYLVISRKYEHRFFKWITTLLVLLSIPCFMFAVSNYYYFDEKGLHYNDLETINQTTTYDWDSFKEVQEVYINDDGPAYLKSYKFFTNDNKANIIPFNWRFRENQNRILEKLREHEIKVTNNYKDL